jgi:hypothetical protein
MNTFLPFSDFGKSASCLDKRRCFKQVVETYQILNVIDGKSNGWQHHPVVKMWLNHRDCLQYYYNIFYDYCLNIHHIKFKKLPKSQLLPMYMEYPLWLGNEEFHLSMRRNLIRKAIDDMSKNNPELYYCLAKNGINLDNTEPLKGYLWMT